MICMRTTLGLAEAAAAPAGAPAAQSPAALTARLYSCFNTPHFEPRTSKPSHDFIPSCSLALYCERPTRAPLPKHLRPEAEIWKPSGHRQVKLPSVLEQVPKVQISGSWEHSSMSGKKQGVSAASKHKTATLRIYRRDSALPCLTYT